MSSVYDNDEVYQGLFLVRERLTPDGAWTQYASARNTNHNVVTYDSPEAVCWCLSGASGLLGLASPNTQTRVDCKLNELSMMLGAADFVHFNDHVCKTQTDVLIFLDWCIAYREWELETGVAS